MCDKEDILKNAQVDHIKPAGTLANISDIQQFAENLLVVVEEDLRLICRDCNSCLSYMDKHNVSFEQAKATKEAIAIQKDLDDKQWLRENGIEPASNAKARREQIVEKLRER